MYRREMKFTLRTRLTLSGAQLLSPFGEDVMQVLGGDDTTLLLVVVPEQFRVKPNIIGSHLPHWIAISQQ